MHVMTVLRAQEQSQPQASPPPACLCDCVVVVVVVRCNACKEGGRKELEVD